MTFSRSYIRRTVAAAERERQASEIANYEREKAAWVAAHSQADHEEYQAAMRRIAAECGL